MRKYNIDFVEDSESPKVVSSLFQKTLGLEVAPVARASSWTSGAAPIPIVVILSLKA
jgi:hypothetical protein